MSKIHDDNTYPVCPANDFSCPYFNIDNDRCTMYLKEHELPMNECEAFYEDEEDYEPNYDECGYNPYMGCYDFDC
jgi:hypothetical protein